MNRSGSMTQDPKRPGMRPNRRKGFVVPYFVVVATVLFGMAGLGLDGGRLFLKKRTLQAAADSAAMAAAFELERGEEWYLTASALRDAGLNGANPNDVTVHWPPSSNGGSYAGNPLFVEVVIEEDVPTTLLRLAGPDNGTVRVRAIAGLVQSGDYCILALNRTANSALWIHGDDNIDLECGMMSNSNSASGLRTGGSVNIDATFLGVSGLHTVDGGTGVVNPQPQTQVPPVADPLADIPEPDFSGWPNGTYDSASDTYHCPGGQCVWNTPVHVGGGNPGDGINPTFESGTHVFQRGLRITGSNASCEGCTFYSTGGGDVTMTGSSTLTLTAPTSGTYQGVALFVSRNASNDTVSLGLGGAQLFYSGALYGPTQHLQIAGTPYGNSAWGMIIGDTIDFEGTSDTILAYPPANQAPVIYRATLVQ